MFNRLIAWSLNNRPIVLAVTLVLFVSGWFTLKKMPASRLSPLVRPAVRRRPGYPALSAGRTSAQRRRARAPGGP